MVLFMSIVAVQVSGRESAEETVARIRVARLTARAHTAPKVPEAEAIATAFRHLDLSRKTNEAEAALVIVPHARFGPRTPVDDRLVWKSSYGGPMSGAA
jgi:hypothetical protein